MSPDARKSVRFALSGLPLLRRLVTIREESAPAARETLEVAGLLGFDAVFARTGGIAVTRHADRGAFRLEVGEGDGRRVFYVKRLGRARAKQVIEAFLGGQMPISKCRREWEFSRGLEAVGVGAVPGLAYGERRCLFWPLESYMVAAEVEGKRLDETLEELRISDPKGSKKRALTGLVADTIARMHDAGFFHKDLYAKHIFIGQNAGPGRISVIDLQRMATGGGESAAVRDLAGLNVSLPRRLVSRTDRLRFFEAYTAKRWPGRRDMVRQLARRIYERSLRVGARSKFRGIEWNGKTTR